MASCLRCGVRCASIAVRKKIRSVHFTMLITANQLCPCGSGARYGVCCEPLHRGEPAGSAEALMRSRYCAFVLNLDDYIQSSWHASTRPTPAPLDPNTRWLGLQIKRHEI